MTKEAYIEILRMAVGNEAEAYEFYRNASEIASDNGLKGVFANLAKEELKHKMLLEGYTSGAEQLSFDEAQDYQVSETVESPKLTTEMRFVDAIALAMKKEEEAMAMYKAFADASLDAAQREMFLELSKMEAGHKVGLEEIYINAACVEAW